MKDLYSNLGVAVALAAAAYDADSTPTAIDLQGFDSAMLVIEVGAGGITFSGTNKVEFKVTHSDDNSTYTAVTADDVQGVDSVDTGGVVYALKAAHDAATATKIGYVGGKRYLKLLADFSGTHGTATPMSAVVVKGHPALAPVA